jgi:hypothetical protein
LAHRARRADYPLREWQTPRWKKLAMWCAALVFCGVAWWLIICGVLALGDWTRGRF